MISVCSKGVLNPFYRPARRRAPADPSSIIGSAQYGIVQPLGTRIGARIISLRVIGRDCVWDPGSRDSSTIFECAQYGTHREPWSDLIAQGSSESDNAKCIGPQAREFPNEHRMLLTQA